MNTRLDSAAIAEIQQLIALYGHAVDADLNLLDAVFTQDAVFDARITGWGMVAGRNAIRAWFDLGKPPHPPSHHSTNVYIYEDAGAVRVRSKFIYINRQTGGPVSGDYNDIVVKTPEGWRISHRALLFRYPENYAPSAPGPEAGTVGTEISDSAGRVGKC